MDVKPAVVQNRLYKNPGDPFDVRLRQLCADNGIAYQAFGIPSQNPRLLESELVTTLAEEVRISKEVALYCLCLELGNVIVLNGTSNKDRMRK